MLRIVIDTNMFVSSLLTRQCDAAQVLKAWRKRQFLLLASSAIIAEIQATLSRPSIRKKYAIQDEEIEQLVALLEQDALVVPGQADVIGSIPDDPKDEMFLSCALDGEADYIISGDKHLLNLEEFRGISILTIKQFLGHLD